MLFILLKSIIAAVLIIVVIDGCRNAAGSLLLRGRGDIRPTTWSSRSETWACLGVSLVGYSLIWLLVGWEALLLGFAIQVPLRWGMRAVIKHVF